MTKLIIASNNQGKLAELSALLSPIFTQNLPQKIDILAQSALNITEAAETGQTFVENALLKARHAAACAEQQAAAKTAALADDSGLCIPALNGRPALYSARFADDYPHFSTANKTQKDALNRQKVLDLLAPHFARGDTVSAYFVCVLTLLRYADDPMPIVATGVWQGHIIPTERGAGGFGYDPIFWLPQLGKTAAELDTASKNAISHRGQALTDLARQCQTLGGF